MDVTKLAAAVEIAKAVGLKGFPTVDNDFIHSVKQMDVESVERIEDPQAREEYYDAVISPVIDILIALTAAQRMPFLYNIEFNDTSTGRGSCGAVHAKTPSFKQAHIANETLGNTDKMMKFIALDAQLSGHQSEFLEALGIPRTPAPKA